MQARTFSLCIVYYKMYRFYKGITQKAGEYLQRFLQIFEKKIAKQQKSTLTQKFPRTSHKLTPISKMLKYTHCTCHLCNENLFFLAKNQKIFAKLREWFYIRPIKQNNTQTMLFNSFYFFGYFYFGSTCPIKVS